MSSLLKHPNTTQEQSGTFVSARTPATFAPEEHRLDSLTLFGIPSRTNDNPFRLAYDLGYRRLVPILPPDAPVFERSSLNRGSAAGKAPAVRGVDGLWRGFDWTRHATTEAELDEWHSWGAGVGIKTGDQGDGTSLLAIDADVLEDKDAANTIWTEVVKAFGKLPVRIGRAPKALYLVRLTGSMPFTKLRFGFGAIEMLSDGQQFVAHGLHQTTRKPYSWAWPIVPYAQLGTSTPDRVSTFLSDLIARFPAAVISETSRRDRSTIDQNALRGDVAHIAEAIAAIPNDASRVDYHEWVKLAVALRSSCAEDPHLGLELFCDYSERASIPDPKCDPETTYWSVKPPFGVGATWIYEQAERSGKWPGRPVAQGWFDHEAAARAELMLTPKGEAPASRTRFDFTPLSAIARRALQTPVAPLVKGLLDTEAMSVWYGDSNVGKTFVVLDLAYHVAAGKAWGGMPVGQCRVAYIAAEGGRGVTKRAAALEARYGPADDMQVLTSPVDLSKAGQDITPLIDAIVALGNVGLIVVDTLSRVLTGGDENSSVDMGALVKNFDRIRAATRAYLLVVHHTGKDAARGARGHSLLRAATDTEIEIADGQISVTKQRDLESGFACPFELRDIVLGVDSAGDPMKSATVWLMQEKIAAAAIGKAGSAANERRLVANAVLNALRDRQSVQLSTCWHEIGADLRKSGVSHANTRQRITDTVKLALGNGDVMIADEAGRLVRLTLTRTGVGLKAPWNINRNASDERDEHHADFGARA